MAVLVQTTIAALSTAPGEAAIAVIRVSGPAAPEIAARVFRCKGAPLFETPRVMRLGQVVAGERVVDSALAVAFPAPGSYTGEDLLEIHCHGGSTASGEVLGTVLGAGAELSPPGEFTRRAFVNGRMDLTQAEAVMDIIRARTPMALAAAGEQLRGRLGRELTELRERLLGLVARVEAWIDFPDEDIDPGTGADFIRLIRETLAEIDSLLSTADTGRILREGVKIVLFGAPNAGKSSLLNRLLGCERAIVTETPGTTRDTIEEPANLGGFPFLITDTAGLRESADPVEQLGMARTHEAMQTADLLVHIVDSTLAGPWPEPGPREVLVLNKTDLPGNRAGIPDGAILVSCKTGEGLETLVEALIQRARGTPRRPAALAINARHHGCLVRARTGLVEALEEFEQGNSPEFAATGLHSALDALGEVLGMAGTEEILGAIFSKFCIGK